ncbi:unnamed protein product [Sphagnum tenellum]
MPPCPKSKRPRLEEASTFSSSLARAEIEAEIDLTQDDESSSLDIKEEFLEVPANSVVSTDLEDNMVPRPLNASLPTLNYLEEEQINSAYWEKQLVNAIRENDIDEFNSILASNEVELRRDEWNVTEAPLHWAVDKDRVQMIHQLVQAGVKINSLVNAEHGGGRCTALHWAVRCNLELTVEVLLGLGADATMEGTWGEFAGEPQEWAKRNANHYNAYILGEAAKEARRMGPWERELSQALQDNDLTTFSSILNANKSKLNFLGKNGRSFYNHPLHKAALREQVHMIKALTSAGIDINTRDKSGFSAFHLAAFFDRKDALKMLLDLGAAPPMRSKLAAVCNNNAEVLSFLEELLDEQKEKRSSQTDLKTQADPTRSTKVSPGAPKVKGHRVMSRRLGPIEKPWGDYSDFSCHHPGCSSSYYKVTEILAHYAKRHGVKLKDRAALQEHKRQSEQDMIDYPDLALDNGDKKDGSKGTLDGPTMVLDARQKKKSVLIDDHKLVLHNGHDKESDKGKLDGPNVMFNYKQKRQKDKIDYANLKPDRDAIKDKVEARKPRKSGIAEAWSLVYNDSVVKNATSDLASDSLAKGTTFVSKKAVIGSAVPSMTSNKADTPPAVQIHRKIADRKKQILDLDTKKARLLEEIAALEADEKYLNEEEISDLKCL